MWARVVDVTKPVCPMPRTPTRMAARLLRRRTAHQRADLIVDPELCTSEGVPRQRFADFVRTSSSLLKNNRLEAFVDRGAKPGRIAECDRSRHCGIEPFRH